MPNSPQERFQIQRPRIQELVKPQGKLVRAVSSVVWDVAVDLRRSSPRFG